MKHRISIVFLAIFGGLLGSTAGAQTLQEQTCRANTPQFPEACACVISRATDAGIVGDELLALLANRTDGIPSSRFQSYGAIYVACIQEALLGTVPAAPPPVIAAPAVPQGLTPSVPAPTAPAQAAPAPTPNGPAPEVAASGPDAPIVTAIAHVSFPAPPFEMSMFDPVPADTWTRVVFGREGEGVSGPGVHDGQGRILMLNCRPANFTETPHILIGGVPSYGATATVNTRVIRSSGAELYNRPILALPVNGPFLLMPLDAALAQAMRQGAEVAFDVEGGVPLRFGLSGSGNAIGPGLCGAERPRRDHFTSSGSFIPNITWTVREETQFERPEPILRYGAAQPFLPFIGLTCENRLIVQSPIYGYEIFPYVGDIAVDSYFGSGDIYPVEFNPFADGRMTATEPLSGDILSAMRMGEVVTITFNTNVEPGEFTILSYRLQGFDAALQARDCPAPPPALGTTEPLDLRQSGLVWEPADFGQAFDGFAENPVPVPGAVLSRTGNTPQLNMQCNGEPFFWGGDWGGAQYVLRIQVDGRADLTRDVTFFARRTQSFPDFGEFDLGAAILNGQTLRVTPIADPARDTLYPLDGMRAALQAAGCQF